MKSNLKVFLITAIAVLSFNSVFSAAVTWDGSSSTNWGTGANWSSNSVPGSGDDVTIPASLTNYPVLDANRTVKSLVMNGGTFNGNGKTLTINNGALTLNAGIMNFNGATINIPNNNDDLLINGGTLNIYGANLFVTDNLEINGGTLNITSTNLSVANDFFITAGTLNLNGLNMTVVDQANLVGGSIINPGTMTVDRLVVNYSGSKILNYNLIVNNTADFQSGYLITTSSNLLTFAYNATVTGASATSHVNGPVRRLVGSSGNSAFTFPTGNTVVYAPITISGHSSARSQDYFTASYFKNESPLANGTKGSGLDHVSKAEYWILDRGTSSGSATTAVFVNLTYDETNRSGTVDNATQLRVARWNGSQWVDHGRGGSSSSNNTAGNTISSAAITSFSPFTFGSSTSLNPLPISLLSFTATKTERSVNLNWSTINEINNDFFTVEKSSDGTHWKEVGTMKSVGNSNEVTKYSIVDANPEIGIQFYRLKQTDLNAEYTYSDIVSINFGTQIKVNLYPNPATDVLNVYFENSVATDYVECSVFDVYGRKVMDVQNSSSLIHLDIHTLEAGVYTLLITSEGNQISKSFIKK